MQTTITIKGRDYGIRQAILEGALHGASASQEDRPADRVRPGSVSGALATHTQSWGGRMWKGSPMFSDR